MSGYRLADGTNPSEYVVGDKFIVVDGTGHSGVKSGDIVTYVEDDGSACPLFNDDNYIYWYRLAKHRPEKSSVEPTDDLQSELEEAYTKIDTLESALEDAVRELISLRELCNTVVIDVNQEEFKAISEMTLEDWELAKEEGWVFETRKGEYIHILFMKPSDETPYTFRGSNDYNYTYWGSIWESSDDEEDIIKRIK